MSFPFVVLKRVVSVKPGGVAGEPSETGGSSQERIHSIQDPLPGGRVSPRGRQTLCEKVMEAVQKDGFSRWVVFGPKDGVLIERDGSMKVLSTVPDLSEAEFVERVRVQSE